MLFPQLLIKGTADILLLQILSVRKEAYGYELVQLINQEGGGIFNFQEGTIYPLLYRLEKQDLLTSYRKKNPNGKERRYYSISKEGKIFLESRTKDLRSYIHALNRILNYKGA